MNAEQQGGDRAEIEALLSGLAAAHAERDAAAIAVAYAPDAVIYDLAPPLGRRGIDVDKVAAWLDTWESPIQVEAKDEALTIAADAAFSSALVRMRGRQGGADQDLWFRSTLCFSKQAEGWRIVHEHTSTPFYMDGSYRAAVDLKP